MSGQIGVLKPEVPTIEESVKKFLDEAVARKLAATTIKKRRELLDGKLLPYCKHRGYRHLRQLTVDALRAFRQIWKYSPLSAVKRLEYLRAFLRFCNESGWIESNAAQTLKQTKVTHRPTMPFDADEMTRILDAAERVGHKGRFGPQIRAMVLLLQYSGLPTARRNGRRVLIRAPRNRAAQRSRSGYRALPDTRARQTGWVCPVGRSTDSMAIAASCCW